MRLSIMQTLLLVLCSFASVSQARANEDTELVRSCRTVAAATEPARRIWLEHDLFAYEMHRALGASGAELRLYKTNLRQTCSRVAHNNAVYQRRNARMIRASSRRFWSPAS